jgi:hypothetical protein
MREITIPASPRQRVVAFLAEFRSAKNDDDMEIRIGHHEGGEPAVLISLNGKDHGFTVTEARKLADIMEDAMRSYPGDPDAAALPNTIMMLRMGADKAIAAAKAQP